MRSFLALYGELAEELQFNLLTCALQVKANEKNLIGFIIVNVFGCIYFPGADILVLLNTRTLEG